MNWCVYKSPIDGHAAVARDAEAPAGWQMLHGPDSFEGCWAWIRANCRGGPNTYFC
jgi:hypothetical protein